MVMVSVRNRVNVKDSVKVIVRVDAYGLRLKLRFRVSDRVTNKVYGYGYGYD